jgi:hypothetical protein
MMDTKKDVARFTIKFNTINPRHKQAIRMLNEAGRTKAALIADALCMYAHYGSDMGIGFEKGSEFHAESKATKPDDDVLLQDLADAANLFFDYS